MEQGLEDKILGDTRDFSAEKNGFGIQQVYDSAHASA
jgi:hypothetical protein